MYLYTFRKTNKIQQVAWLENVELTGQKWSSKFFSPFLVVILDVFFVFPL